MRKLKIFLDPVNQVAPWLNKWEDLGYILANVDKYTYIFKEDNRDFMYEVLYIGDFSIKELEVYKNYLRKAGKRYFHLPLDQGGMITGDFGFLRPFSKRAEELESTFSHKNREILVIESPKGKPENPENNYEHLGNEYSEITIKYVFTVLFVFLGLFFVLRSINKSGFSLIAGIAIILLLIFFFDYLLLSIFAYKNSLKYKAKAKNEK
ncbi:MAG: hypothetical protein Q4E02_00660 [Lagierella massiliensis]|nr:hypothetical protein [Lagierella massiliensis]